MPGSSRWLATGAEMRSSSTDHDALEWSTASDARRGRRTTPVDAEIGLVGTRFPVGVLEAGEGRSPVVEPLAQHGADRSMEALDFRRRDAVGAALRMETSAEERLVDVNVAEASDEALIEENALELAGAACQAGAEHIGGEGAGERLGSDPTLEEGHGVGCKVKHPTELPLVGEADVAAAIELDGEVLKALWGR